jgi:UDP-perosamine 4-acetyltransferase
MTQDRGYVVLGAGGHGKVVIAALRSRGLAVLSLLDPDERLWGHEVEGTLVHGGDEAVADFSATQIYLANGIGASDRTAIRRGVFEKFAAKGYLFPALQAQSAIKAASASLGAGSQLLTRAVVHPGAIIGDDSVVNTAAVVEHDCRIGSHVFMGPGAVLCGGVHVEDCAFIGAGAIVLPGVRIGGGALIGAGAVVRKDVAPGGRALEHP